MGGAVSTGEDNDDLVDNLVAAEYIKTPIVEKVFRAVDRAFFYLPDHRESAYKDLAWKHEHLHLSAPCIYSEVMESLKLESGLSFLNLGSGTGYLSTMVGLVLGAYGVNHGVEVYPEVAEYASKKVQEYKQHCDGFDEFELCDPAFVVGNCLQLNSGQQYDRVYCGAACPVEHENYMKNLIKVGGILVMPLNDQLLQIYRNSETSWETKSVLPVSFASLVVPLKESTGTMIDLPEVQLPDLQHVSRVSIRNILRKNIHSEHPQLRTIRKRKQKPKKKKSKQRRINIVPMSMGMMILGNFEDSDAEGDMIENELSPRDDTDPDTDVSMTESKQDDAASSSVTDVSMAESKQIPAIDPEAITSITDNANSAVSSTSVVSMTDESKHGASDSSEDEGFDIEEEFHNTVESNSNGKLIDISGRKNNHSDHSDKHEDSNSDETEDSDNDDDEDDDEESGYSYAHSSRIAARISARVRQMKRLIQEGRQLQSHLRRTDSDEQALEEISSDGSESDSMDFDSGHMLLQASKLKGSHQSQRKLRCSSNTSAETETSGIGTLGDPSDFDSAGGASEKPSPSSSLESEGPAIIPRDNDDENIERVPTVSVKKYMHEKVDQLPLPHALKNYLLYYRS